MLPENFGELQYGQIWDKHRTSFNNGGISVAFPSFPIIGLVLEKKKKESVPVHAGTHQTTSQLL